MKLKRAQNGMMIQYIPTENQIKIPDTVFPEIVGYQRQFPIEVVGGIDEKSKEPQIVYIQPEVKETTVQEQVPVIGMPTEVQVPATTRESKKKQESSIKSTSKRYNDRNQFVSELTDAYTRILKSKGINPEYAKYLAIQDAHESNFGKSYAGNWNYGNITVGSSGASYTEGKDHDGYGRPIINKFRNYNSLDDFINNKIDLLNGKRYRAFNGDLSGFYSRVKAGGYAGDPNYVINLTKLYQQYFPKGKNGLVIPKFQNPADTIPKVTDTLINGSKTFTQMCAEFQNKVLRNSGYKTANDAWNLSNADLYMSGYDTLEKPTKYNLYKVQKYNRNAANNLKQNLDSNMLDPNQVYIANMYYIGSPFQEEAYNKGKNNITGTHTGYVKFNRDTNSWEVTHNIDGTVHVDQLNNILGSNGRYGVTALLKPRKETSVDRIKNAVRTFGKKVYDTGPISFKQNGGNLYGEIEPSVITAISENKTSNPYGKQYIHELNDFRNQAMNDFGLTDKEYADIASFAVNVANMETKLGDSSRYKAKNAIPDFILSLAKRVSGKNNIDLSKGLTQIKYNTDLQLHPELAELYNKYKITNLEDPKQSAKATVLRTLYGSNQIAGDYHYSDGTKIPNDIKLAMWWNRGKLTDNINLNPIDTSAGGASGYARRFEHNKLIQTKKQGGRLAWK